LVEIRRRIVEIEDTRRTQALSVGAGRSRPEDFGAAAPAVLTCTA
jgi:hypothetical protein